MTSYFDSATSAASSIHRDEPNILDTDYVRRVQAIEAPVIQIALANACDAEFPDDLRRKICRVIAKNDYNNISQFAAADARRMLIGTRHSELIADLHSIFHDLARRRVPLRRDISPDLKYVDGTGTFWSDSPTQNLTTIATHAAATDVEKQRVTPFDQMLARQYRPGALDDE